MKLIMMKSVNEELYCCRIPIPKIVRSPLFHLLSNTLAGVVGRFQLNESNDA